MTRAQTKVRRASEADAEAMGRLMYDFNSEFETPVPPASVVARRLAEHVSSGEATVLLAGEGPDGLAVLRFRPALYDQGLEAYLQELYVAPQLRGRGMGRALLEEAIRVAREAGAVRIELGTSEDDVAARGLYESAGFSNREGPGGPVMYVYEREL